MLIVGFVDWFTGTEASFSIFYLIAVALAVAWLGRTGGVLVALGSAVTRLVGDSLIVDNSEAHAWIWWNTTATLVVHLGVVWILDAYLSLNRILEQRILDRTRALRAAVEGRERIERELREAGSQERAAIGRELHDELCQHLVASAFAAKVLEERLGRTDQAAANDAHIIVNLIEDGITKTRDLARGLILAGIKPGELGPELAELAKTSSRKGGRCYFRQDGTPVIEDAATAAQLFRIAQEAIRNAFRHGSPTRVDVVLGGNDQSFYLTVEDDGPGIPPPENRGVGIGLRIMAHRAAVIGGDLSITSATGSGTRITCAVASAAQNRYSLL